MLSVRAGLLLIVLLGVILLIASSIRERSESVSEQPKFGPQNFASAATVGPKTLVSCYSGSKNLWRPGKCADDKRWFLPWVRSRPGTNWTLVDVGANKGYVVAQWLDILVDKTCYSPRHLGAAIFRAHPNVTTGFMSMCGGCCECVESPSQLLPSQRGSIVRVFAYEPSAANYKWLQEFFGPSKEVSVVHAAVGDRSGHVFFPDVEFGVEIGKVQAEPTPGYVPVKIVTLDDNLTHLSFIDVLATDAEGYDQFVARGAANFLSAGKVGVYQFEMYRQDNYYEVFTRLERWGFICYFETAARRPRSSRRPHRSTPGVPMLVRITGCWQPQFGQFSGWVNALCYNKNVQALKPIFEQLEASYHKGATGNCDGRLVQRRVVTEFVSKYVVNSSAFPLPCSN